MQIYTKNYLKHFNYCKEDFIKCECCNNRASEIHHILNKNRLTENRNRIENIMAICRECHNNYGEINYLIPLLFEIHKKVMLVNGVKFDSDWIESKIEYYKNIT